MVDGSDASFLQQASSTVAHVASSQPVEGKRLGSQRQCPRWLGYVVDSGRWRDRAVTTRGWEDGGCEEARWLSPDPALGGSPLACQQSSLKPSNPSIPSSRQPTSSKTPYHYNGCKEDVHANQCDCYFHQWTKGTTCNPVKVLLHGLDCEIANTSRKAG